MSHDFSTSVAAGCVSISWSQLFLHSRLPFVLESPDFFCVFKPSPQQVRAVRNASLAYHVSPNSVQFLVQLSTIPDVFTSEFLGRVPQYVEFLHWFFLQFPLLTSVVCGTPENRSKRNLIFQPLKWIKWYQMVKGKRMKASWSHLWSHKARLKCFPSKQLHSTKVKTRAYCKQSGLVYIVLAF